MIVTNNGILINGIQDVQKSTMFTGSYAILDSDNVWIQIPASELDKLLNKYLELRKQTPKPVSHIDSNASPFLTKG